MATQVDSTSHIDVVDTSQLRLESLVPLRDSPLGALLLEELDPQAPRPDEHGFDNA